MYEHLRNDFIYKLNNTFNTIQIEMICCALDSAMMNYDVVEKETSLVVWENQFPVWAEMYLQAKRLEGLSPNSEKLYRNRLKIFFEIMQMPPQEINAKHVRNFLSVYQAQTGISNRTLDKFRQILHGFFTWCVDEKYLASNPTHNIKEIKYEVKPRQALKRMQLEQLRRACKTKRELAIIDTLYSTGCRVSELANMKKSDINVYDKTVHIIGKGKKHRTAYFNIDAQLSLNEWLDSREGDSDYLFTKEKEPYTKLSINRLEEIVKDIGKRIDIDICPHIMRHTTATLSLQNGMPLPQVQKMLGHSSSDTTLIYAEIADEDVHTSHLKYVV